MAHEAGRAMHEGLTTARLEAFSDGVIAVIITIMVLELKVPTAAEMSTAAVLQMGLKMVGVYLLSFVQVGIYWVNHHYLLDDVREVTHGMLWANLALLFCLSLIPYGTLWIANRGVEPVPVAVYAVCFVAPATAWMALSAVIFRETGIRPANGPVIQAVSTVLNVGAIYVALRSPLTALGMILTVAFLWLLPPRRIARRIRERRTHSHSL